MTLDFSLCLPVPVQLPDGTWIQSPPPPHVHVGVEAIVRNPFFLLADEMGGMKSAQAIISAQMMFPSVIDKVLILAPASVRSVWFDQELGELAKHLWMPSTITEFHAKVRTWRSGNNANLQFLVSNYEFIRSKNRLEQLLPFCGPKTFLILDESSAVKSHAAQQTKATLILRRACGRVLLLNGTPIANSPMDMFSQGQIMDPRILGCRTYFHFRARYAVMGGFNAKQIIGYQNLPDLQARFKPFILRRLKKDCTNLPEALPPVTFQIPLEESTWKSYKEMRDDMVVWLSDTSVATTQQAAVKTLRLAQITSGFLGGIEDANIDDGLGGVFLGEPKIEHLDGGGIVCRQEVTFPIHFIEDGVAKLPSMPSKDQLIQSGILEIGREKLDFVLDLYDKFLREDPNLKLLIWCRFRAELARLVAAFEAKGVLVGAIHGGQKRQEREAALRLLDPRTAPAGPAVLCGTYGTGSLGHNFTACHTVVDMSYDYSHFKKVQADARVHRPGQVHAVSYFYLMATGPAGQKTIDHTIIKARSGKADIANWVTSDWVRELQDE